MEVKSSPQITNLNPSVLYLDDIVNIAQTITEDDNTFVFSFECQGQYYKCSKIEDFAELEELKLPDISEANLVSRDRNTLELFKVDFRSITTQTPSSYTLGVCTKVKEYINERSSKMVFVEYLLRWGAGVFFFLVPLLSYYELIKLNDFYAFTWWLSIGLLITIPFSKSMFLFSSTTIKLYNRSDATSFIKEYKKDIIKFTISAIIGIVLLKAYEAIFENNNLQAPLEMSTKETGDESVNKQE